MTIRAVVCPRYGSPEVVRVEQRPAPEPAPDQVRVRVAAAAVNFPDVLLVAGRYQIQVPAPFVPGSEFAGTVIECGSAATSYAVGDRVRGTAMFGAFAEEVVVGTDALDRIPDGTDMTTAAAAGVAHRTAYHALRSTARVGAGDPVVVLGAGGGVGLAAVTLGAELGAHVVAVASSAEKLAAARAHGARHLVDHRAGDLRQALRDALPDGAAAVLDPVGGGLSEPSLRALRRGGRFVTVGFASGEIPRIPLNLVLVKGVHVVGFQFGDLPPDEFARNERELADLLASGRARPHIGAVYPLAETAAALRLVADGQAIGKVVIDLATVSWPGSGPPPPRASP